MTAGDKFVRVKGARENNLKNIHVEIPRDSFVVFTGVSGSGKSSLAFGTLYAEAQRRYLESVSPYARRLFNQMSIPDVDDIEGLPPAVALQQQRGAPSTRSSVGSVTTIANLLRMLYSRAGVYPPNQAIIYAEGFSPNTPEGACPHCHGLGRILDATEKSMVLDGNLTIRERAVAAWPSAWQGQNLRDILVTLGVEVDTPWKKLPKKTRDWILYTKDKPTVPVYAGFTAREVKAALRRKEDPSYMGSFTSAREYVLSTFATSQSALMKKRVSKYIVSTLCPECKGKRLKKVALSIKFEGRDIGETAALPMKKLLALFLPYADGSAGYLKKIQEKHPEQVAVARTIAEDIVARLHALVDLGLGHLSLDRRTPTLSPGELQRLRLATQIHSNLFGVVYVLDEPSAGLHPTDTEALLRAFEALKSSGNSLFVVEHELDVIQQADWIVDVGPKAGEHGGEIVYSGPLSGLRRVPASQTAQFLFNRAPPAASKERAFSECLQLRGITRHNLRDVSVDLPLRVLTSVTGISGSGKSSLMQALVELLTSRLGREMVNEELSVDLESEAIVATHGEIAGACNITRVIQVDQRSIGRTPRSNLATYTGLFDHVRTLFAQTKLGRSRRYDPGRFSFNIPKGRCANCEGEGFVMVELLFLPSVYAPCPACHGARFNEQTLEVTYKGKNVAEVLQFTVDEAAIFFADDSAVMKTLRILQEIGLGYIRLGQPATELSGGEAQRIKLATELQRQARGDTLYLLDEPTTGLHPADVERVMVQLQKLVAAGNTVITVEHDMRVVAESDWVIDIGPGAGEDGGKIVAQGSPKDVAGSSASATGKYLARFLAQTGAAKRRKPGTRGSA